MRRIGQQPFAAGAPINGGQLTCYHVGDAGDKRTGLPQAYDVLTTGQYSGTSNLNVPFYASNAVTMVAATKTVADASMPVVATGDTVVVHGGVNDGAVLTVATGGTGSFVVNEAILDQAAGTYITLCRRVAHSNNCVRDKNTGRMWSRYTSNGEKIGPASDGKMVWYDAAKCFTIHPAAADLQMVAPNILRIVAGAGELGQYFAGERLVFSGFANAVNNLPGYRVLSVAVNGADLDITFDPSNQVVISEAAGGSRTIKVVCSNIFGYSAAACQAALGGYTDWRIPTYTEVLETSDAEAPNGFPNATAFPSFPGDYLYLASTRPDNVTKAMLLTLSSNNLTSTDKTNTFLVWLVR